jgi:endonuclease/exonuclease/phosphatase family metal-dependent hydrolase
MKSLLIAIVFAVSSIAYSQGLKVMTYNIRLDLASDGENRWDNRKEMLAGQALFYEPDFMGVQEALYNQMDYLDKNLPAYDFIGVGRDDGKQQGEYSAIFYNAGKFEVLEQHTFWLSQTPEKPSKGWDAAYNRVCTYGLFRDKKTKQKLWVFNTHFDHVGNVARVESAKLILKKIKEVNKQNLPVILTGDFNLEEESESIKLISTEMSDAKKSAKQSFGPAGTFNAFEFSKPVTKRIDYIFTKGVIINKYAVLSDSDHCRYPSDHLPVYAEIYLKKK